MSENNNSQRQFDWGPPVQTSDGLKEWLVYLLIVVVLGVGTWFLLDINDRKKTEKSLKMAKDIIAVEESEDVTPKKTITSAPKVSIEKKDIEVKPYAPSIPKKEFFVQIGAFGDEPSANEVFDLLKKDNIPATLLKPDEQFEIFRLVVGPYETEKEAESKAEQLNEIGFPSFVVEGQ